jgi:serine protease Do
MQNLIFNIYGILIVVPHLSLHTLDIQNLKVPDFGDSSKLTLGDKLTFVGNPGGPDYMGTVNQGLLSGLDREIDYSNSLLNLIQLDKEISNGDSGSAICNQKGEVVALSTNLFSNNENNFGFAMPINDVLDYTNSILNKTSNTNDGPYLGLTVTPRENSSGLLVDVVVENSSAEKSDIKKGDIILKFNETEMNTYDDLLTYKKNSKVGDEIDVSLIRNNENISITLKLEN